MKTFFSVLLFASAINIHSMNNELQLKKIAAEISVLMNKLSTLDGQVKTTLKQEQQASINHYKLKNGIYYCLFYSCSEQRTTERSMKDHVKFKHFPNFKCNFCQEKITESTMNEHAKKVHGKKNEKTREYLNEQMTEDERPLKKKKASDVNDAEVNDHNDNDDPQKIFNDFFGLKSGV